MELIDELREGLNRQGTALVELSMQIDKQEISIKTLAYRLRKLEVMVKKPDETVLPDPFDSEPPPLQKRGY